MTFVGHFNSHVERLTGATVALVNAVTPGHDGGRPMAAPIGVALADAIAEAVRTEGFAGRPSLTEAEELAKTVRRARLVFEELEAGREKQAALIVNDLLVRTQARPHLDPQKGGGWALHFHGPDDDFRQGWAAGIAAGLAMAIGGDLGSRLGVCEATGCDRVYLDSSRNAHRRFCSTRCQNRIKAAAHRRRRAEETGEAAHGDAAAEDALATADAEDRDQAARRVSVVR